LTTPGPAGPDGVFGGRYRLIELLGEGGMATVYRARDTRLDRDVAVKVLRPEYGRDAAFIARFRQEAQSAASLNHPNIVNVFDYGTDEAGPFIVMELVDGEDLSSVLAERGALPPTVAARIAQGVVDGLGAAHARGIVHRDVKPSNITLDRTGRVRLLDFGIARAFSEAQLTLPGTTLGSVHYFSPEQARGEAVTPQSDLYSVGLVLYEMLTGQRAWGGDSAAAVAVARLTADAPRASDIRPDVPPALDAIVARALAREPGQRFDSADEFSRALGAYIAAPHAAAPIAAPARMGDGSPTVVGAAAPTFAAGTAPRRSALAPAPPARAATYREREVVRDEDRGGGWGWVAALLGLLVLVVAGALAFFLANRGPATPSAALVAVPDLVNRPFEEAQGIAEDAGFTLVSADTQESTEVAPNTVIATDPAFGESAPEGSEIAATVAVEPGNVQVPDLRGLTEAEAVERIRDASLARGDRTLAFDPVVPEGSVISSTPSFPEEVAPGTRIDYIVSQGPDPTASPSPSPPPTPTPSPPPTPSPTAPPTEAPTAAPTPAPVTVGDYRCTTPADAQEAIEAAGLVVGQTVPANPPADSLVIEQEPRRGRVVVPGTAVDLLFAAPDEPQTIALCGLPAP
jgi:serine/threonine-protein kinase